MGYLWGHDDEQLMFFGAEAFNHPLGDWQVDKVTDMHRMFHGASASEPPRAEAARDQLVVFKSKY